MKSLIVYTAIVGGVSDTLSEVSLLRDPKNRQTRYICFSDSDLICPSGWEIHGLRFSDDDPRRTARWHKTMGHELFTDCDVTIWHDGTHHLRVNPWEIIEQLDLRSQSFATFKHPLRSCVYEEIEACLAAKNDLPEKLLKHAARYREEGYPARAGLFETACVVRARRSAVVALNQAWWSEIDSGSSRDQVSLPYAMWKLGFTELGLLPGCRDESRFFTFKPHH